MVTRQPDLSPQVSVYICYIIYYMCHKYTKCLNEVFRVKIGAILETLRPVDNIIIHQLLKQEATKG